MSLSDEQREALAGVVADAICRDRPSYSPTRPCTAHGIQAEGAADALAPVVARMLADARAEALREAADDARGMHDPVAPDCAEWADWLDARADKESA